MQHPQRTVLSYAASVAKHLEAFQQFRQALIEAAQGATGPHGKTPGANWEVGELGHHGFAFPVHYIGLRLRYVLEMHASSSQFSIVLHALDRFDEEDYSVVASTVITSRCKTDLRFFDDGDELFANTVAGARELFLLQLGTHLGLLAEQ